MGILSGVSKAARSRGRNMSSAAKTQGRRFKSGATMRGKEEKRAVATLRSRRKTRAKKVFRKI